MSLDLIKNDKTKDFNNLFIEYLNNHIWPRKNIR